MRNDFLEESRKWPKWDLGGVKGGGNVLVIFVDFVLLLVVGRRNSKFEVVGRSSEYSLKVKSGEGSVCGSLVQVGLAVVVVGGPGHKFLGLVPMMLLKLRFEEMSVSSTEEP